MSDATELKPCPFCGNEAYNDAPTWRVFGRRTGHAYAVACRWCEVSSPGNDDAALAIAAWNTRAEVRADPAVQALVDALRSIAETSNYTRASWMQDTARTALAKWEKKDD